MALRRLLRQSLEVLGLERSRADGTVVVVRTQMGGNSRDSSRNLCRTGTSFLRPLIRRSENGRQPITLDNHYGSASLCVGSFARGEISGALGRICLSLKLSKLPTEVQIRLGV